MLNRKRNPLLGRRFGSYLVVSLGLRHRYWFCQCDCGTVREIWYTNLTRGLSTSCGCMKGAAISAAKTTHAMSGTQFYSIWKNMHSRCSNPSVDRYQNYGGRGIAVCERWQKFENFYADMWTTWSPGLSIERKEVDGNYNSENCIWIEMPLQAQNKTTTRLIDTQWGPLCLNEAARRASMPRETLRYRADKWPEHLWFAPLGTKYLRS